MIAKTEKRPGQVLDSVQVIGILPRIMFCDSAPLSFTPTG